jgi:hypothetical protein
VTIVPTVLDFRRRGVACSRAEIKRSRHLAREGAKKAACFEQALVAIADRSADNQASLASCHPAGNDGAYRASK